MVNNPELLKSLLDSPFVQQMMSDPETMQKLMQTNPQLNEVMEVRFRLQSLLKHSAVFFLKNKKSPQIVGLKAADVLAFF